MDRIRNITLRLQIQIPNVAQKAAKLKWDGAGHICRIPSKLCAKITTEVKPCNS